MLSRLRSGSKSIVVKSLLILVALTFVLWGVGDVFRSSSSRTVATVGDVNIPFEQFNEAVQREVSRYTQLFGKSLSEAEIAALGLRQQVLSQIVQEELLSQRAKELDLRVGKDIVFERVANTPVFHDESGKFNKDQFREVLRSNGLTEQRYIDALTNDMAIGFLVTSILESDLNNGAITQVLYRAQHEKRVADLLLVPATQVKVVPEASEAELLEFYNKNVKQYTTPEKRDVAYIVVTPDVAEKELAFSDEQLEEWFEGNIARYSKPEQRHVSQYLFDSKDEAEQALQTLRGGGAIGVESTDLGEVSREGLPQNITNTVFNLAKGEFSEPVSSDLGWHLFYVSKLVESRTPAFGEIKQQVLKDIRAEQAEGVFYSLTNQIEDDIAGGLGLQKVAEKYSLDVKRAQGVKASSRKLGELDAASELVAVAFANAEGELSSLIALEDGSGYAVVSVEKVQEQRVQPLDEVRARVADAWKVNKKQQMTRELADELASQIKEGAEIAKLASVPGLSFLPQRSFGKPNGKTESEYSDAFVDALFSLAPGGTTEAYYTSNGGYVIGRLEQVIETDETPQTDAEGYAQVQQELRDSFGNELMEQYIAYLQTLYPVDINQEAVTPGSE